jgi:hypothetical protein
MHIPFARIVQPWNAIAAAEVNHCAQFVRWLKLVLDAHKEDLSCVQGSWKAAGGAREGPAHRSYVFMCVSMYALCVYESG